MAKYLRTCERPSDTIAANQSAGPLSTDLVKSSDRLQRRSPTTVAHTSGIHLFILPAQKAKTIKIQFGQDQSLTFFLCQQSFGASDRTDALFLTVEVLAGYRKD